MNMRISKDASVKEMKQTCKGFDELFVFFYHQAIGYDFDYDDYHRYISCFDITDQIISLLLVGTKMKCSLFTVMYMEDCRMRRS